MNARNPRDSSNLFDTCTENSLISFSFSIHPQPAATNRKLIFATRRTGTYLRSAGLAKFPTKNTSRRLDNDDDHDDDDGGRDGVCHSAASAYN